MNYTNHYKEILEGISCFQMMCEDDFCFTAKNDASGIIKKGGLLYRLRDTDYMLIAYSDAFGASKNLIRWFALLHGEPFPMVIHIDPEEVFESLNDEQLEELLPHIEMFMESIPAYCPKD